MPFGRVVQADILAKGTDLALRVEGLRMVFDVFKDLKKGTNRASLMIYNLSEESRAKIQDTTDSLRIMAGYEDESVDEIFFGDVVAVNHRKDGPDFISELKANDGQKSIRNGFANLSYAEGASLKAVLRDAVRSLGLPVKTTEYLSLFDDQKFLHGFAHFGRGRDALDTLTARAGLEWSIQGGQVQILRKGGVLPKGFEEIPLLTPENGLIGSPERLTRVEDESPEKKPPGWSIRSVLVGRIEPGGQVGVRSLAIPRPTAFRVEAVQHRGDTDGEEFVTITEAIDPGVLIERT